ncbi:MATE family efflux transporter [Planctomicrobium piriforme]|nr:MATE family efflux transporter [Planctomicrobium piriforme]
MADTIDDQQTNPAPAGSLRELMHVAFPLVISAGSLSLMNVVDRIFLAQLSIDALAAAMPAAMLSWTSMSLAFGMAGYTNAFVSQYEGAGRKDRVAAAMWQGIFVALAGGISLLPMILFAPEIFGLMGHAAHVQQLEIEYFSWLCPVAIPTLLSTVLTAFFTARKRTAVVMWVNIGTSLLNAAAAYSLIFGAGPMPGLGMKGAAIGTVLAQSLGAVCLAALMFRDGKREGYRFRENFGFDLELIRRMIRFGVPNGIQMLLDVGSFTVFIALVGRLGTEDQAATNLAFTLNSLAFVPMIGMGTAVVTLVGHRVGERKPELATRTVWIAFALSGGYMLLFALIYLSVPGVILYPFMHGDEVALFEAMEPTVIMLLRYVALYTFFDAMAIIFGSAVRGAGDTMFSLIFTVVGGWLLMVAPTIWAIRNGYGLHGCWIAVSVTVIVMGLGFLFRFQQGHWKTMQVIEEDPLEGLP